MRISDWSSDVCSSDLTPSELIYFSFEGEYRHAPANTAWLQHLIRQPQDKLWKRHQQDQNDQHHKYKWNYPPKDLGQRQARIPRHDEYVQTHRRPQNP